MINVLVVDDNAMVRAGICEILMQYSDISVVGQAADGTEAVQLAFALSPDVILMDVAMPNVDGVVATREILSALPDAVVVVLTTYDATSRLNAALSAGARGYLVKEDAGRVLGEAIRSAAGGAAPFSPAAAPALNDVLRGAATHNRGGFGAVRAP